MATFCRPTLCGGLNGENLTKKGLAREVAVIRVSRGLAASSCINGGRCFSRVRSATASLVASRSPTAMTERAAALVFCRRCPVSASMATNGREISCVWS